MGLGSFLLGGVVGGVLFGRTKEVHHYHTETEYITQPKLEERHPDIKIEFHKSLYDMVVESYKGMVFHSDIEEILNEVLNIGFLSEEKKLYNRTKIRLVEVTLQDEVDYIARLLSDIYEERVQFYVSRPPYLFNETQIRVIWDNGEVWKGVSYYDIESGKVEVSQDDKTD